jgi:hypothetical protein
MSSSSSAGSSSVASSSTQMQPSEGKGKGKATDLSTSTSGHHDTRTTPLSTEDQHLTFRDSERWSTGAWRRSRERAKNDKGSWDYSGYLISRLGRTSCASASRLSCPAREADTPYTSYDLDVETRLTSVLSSGVAGGVAGRVVSHTRSSPARSGRA